MKKIVLDSEIEWDLSEEYQSDNICFCLATENEKSFVRQTPFFLCRDFFSDQIVCSFIELSFGCYGFTATSENSDFSKEHVLLLKMSELPAYFEDGLQLLGKMEVSFGWEPTKLIGSSKGGQRHALSFDQRYLKSTVMFSLLTHFIRAIFQTSSKSFESFVSFEDYLLRCNFDGNVKRYQEAINNFVLPHFCVLYENVETIFQLSKLKEKFTSPPRHEDIVLFHDYGGILSFSKSVKNLSVVPDCFQSSKAYEIFFEGPVSRFTQLIDRCAE